MSEALDKVASVKVLPIFPLPLVMLPGEVLPLHIFEERYRKMLRDVETERNFFGVSLFDPQSELDVRPALGSIGCIAEIRESETFADGRSNILTQGVVRYRIDEYVDLGEPYLTAEVTAFEDDADDRPEVGETADRVFESFKRLAKAAFRMSGSKGQLPEVQPSAPEPLSFLITAAFNFDNEKKYWLLEMTSTLERLSALHTIVTRTVEQMEASADIRAAANTNGHSKTKLDL